MLRLAPLILFVAAAGSLQMLPARAQTGPVAASTVSAAATVDGQWEGEAHPAKGWPVFLLLHVVRGSEGAAGTLFVLGQTLKLDAVTAVGDRFSATIGTDKDATRLEATVRDGRLVGTLTENGTTLPFALNRIPTYAKPASRVEAWMQDLDALATRVPKADYSFTPATRAAFDAATTRLRTDLPRLTDQQIMVRMATAMALARNAHTRFYLVRSRTQVRMLPIRLWWFADGPRVVRAAPEQRRLLGCRVDRIGTKSIAAARAAVDPMFAGSPTWADYMSSYSLASTDILNGAGITPSADAATLGLSDCGGTRQVTLAALPLAKTNSAVESWWDLAPGFAKDSWPQVLGDRNVAPPLALSNANDFYWHRFDPASGVFYFNFNRAADMSSETLEAYAKRLLATFDTNPVKAFVLDLRFNTGGNGNLSAGLMEALRARTKGMPRFVIIGRATFSAGIADAARWRELPDVVLVGEPAGDSLDFWAEGGNILLPNSGIAAHFANGPHSYSPAPCQRGLYCLNASAPNLAPDLRASMTWRDYVAGRDPAMAAITAKLARRRQG
ncbi:MAG: hypothetical protein JWO16_1299 [Sphingomonas bacterium]|nr:hypothetical protein [Sphingomonas bacterium]